MYFTNFYFLIFYFEPFSLSASGKVNKNTVSTQRHILRVSVTPAYCCVKEKRGVLALAHSSVLIIIFFGVF